MVIVVVANGLKALLPLINKGGVVNDTNLVKGGSAVTFITINKLRQFYSSI